MSGGLFMNMLDGLGFFDADLMPQAFNQHLYTKIFLSFTLLKFTLTRSLSFWKPFTGKTMEFF